MRRLRVDWPSALNALLPHFHPTWVERTGMPERAGYYWSVQESEWAADVMFRRARDLAALYPHLIRHATVHLGSREVLRFLGRRLPPGGRIPNRFAGEVVSDLRERPEGLRVKHRLNANSIKMYDKQGSVLRVETTLNDADDIKVYRAREGDACRPKHWRALRRGVADIHRRAEVSQAANRRYFASLSAAESPTPLGVLAERLCRPARLGSRRVRALHPLSGADAKLLEAVNRGEFLLNGFRNRDLRERLYGAAPAEAKARRQQSAAVTR